MNRRPARVRTAPAVAIVGAIVLAAAAVGYSSGGAAAAKPIKGPDTSHYQHVGGKAINWVKVAKAGKAFAIAKATEGTSYTDPWFARDYARSLAAGLVHGSYHFARPAFPIASTAKAQARHYAAVIGDVTTPKTLPPALDLEVTGGLGPGQLVTWAQDFLLDLRGLTGRTPMLYTYPSFWDNDLDDATALARYPLWMAWYGVKTAPISNLWQYTDHASIKGIPGAVDQSVFTGTSGLPWATLSDGTVATNWTAATPGAPVAIRASASGGAVTVSWRPGDAGTERITGYTVTAKPGGEQVHVGPTTFSVVVPNLTPSVSYTFTVSATNGVGAGTVSKPTAPVVPTIPTRLATKVPPAVTYGAGVGVQTTLSRKDTHDALSGQTVLIYRRGSTRSSWRQVRALVTDRTGRAQTTLHPSRNARLEAVFPGVTGVARASRYANVVVRPTVGAELSRATVLLNHHSVLSGQVTPFTVHQKVVLERKLGGVWQSRATARVGRHGGFHFLITPHASTVHSFRVVAPATPTHGRGHSPTQTLTVG